MTRPSSSVVFQIKLVLYSLFHSLMHHISTCYSQWGHSQLHCTSQTSGLILCILTPHVGMPFCQHHYLRMMMIKAALHVQAVAVKYQRQEAVAHGASLPRLIFSCINVFAAFHDPSWLLA